MDIEQGTQNCKQYHHVSLQVIEPDLDQAYRCLYNLHGNKFMVLLGVNASATARVIARREIGLRSQIDLV